MTAPLDGLRVVELCNGMTNAQTAQMLADFGAEVVQIEPPGGTPLRAHPSYPIWGRGKRSIELDLKSAEGLERARQLIDGADVLLEAFRPGVAERLGLGCAELSARNPRLIHVSITGWGRQSPLSNVPGYEGLIMAKIGAMASYSIMTERPGPSFFSVAYGSWSASQMALQGLLAALIERETSGRGQYVETNLALATAGLDPWNQMLAMISQRYPDAFVAGRPFDDEGRPATGFPLKLLVALTADGHWLQFSQVQPRLFQALMHELDLEWMYNDPEWSKVPDFPEVEKRVRLNEILLEAVRKKTLAEWQETFDRNPNVFAEVFRRGTDLLHHPQVIHDRQTVEVADDKLGRTLQPAPLIRLDKTPAGIPGPAPALDADRDHLAGWAPSDSSAPHGQAPASLPLEGITVLELGSFYAAPYGATLLTDLGARVIKIEPIEGEPMRVMVGFPEAGAAKVLQGKESVGVDVTSAEGREIVLELARRSDVVLRSYRAGVAERLGIGAEDLLAVNPDLVYLDAPGYGIDGPYGHRPAFAPTISAGTGIAMRNVGRMPSPEELQKLPQEALRPASVRLTAGANSGGTQPDGIAALAVGTALALGIYLRKKGHGGQRMLTTMLLSAAHSLSETMIEYLDREAPGAPAMADSEAFGFGALYRLYPASDGWIFLAAPTEREWSRLVGALRPYVDLTGDRRFADEASRRRNDGDLAAELAKVFATRAAHEWESELLGADVGCVVAENTTMEEAYMGAFGQASGYLADAESPVFDVYPRVGPLVSFSRSRTRSLGGCTNGQHTEAVLTEIGYTGEQIADLRAQGRIG